MVRLGMANSRMKDYYDIWILSRDFDFDGRALMKAIQATFSTRHTEVPEKVPVGLSNDFYSNPSKQAQWKAFISRTRLEGNKFEVIVADTDDFLTPPTKALVYEEPFEMKWVAGEGWESK